MKLKDFVCYGLWTADAKFEGKDYDNEETKNFITKVWLTKIDPRLPKHIRDTWGLELANSSIDTKNVSILPHNLIIWQTVFSFFFISIQSF